MKIVSGESVEDVGEAGVSPRPPDVAGLARGGGFLIGGSFFDFGARFVIGLLLARFLGTADYGLYQLATSAAAIFAGIASLGLDDAMVRYVAILSGRRDRAGVWGTVQIGLGIALPVAVAMGAFLYVAAPWVSEGMFDEPALTPALRLMAFVVPVLTLSNVLLGITRGFGRMDHAAFSENVVQSVIRVILLLILSVSGLDLYDALIVFAVGDIASSVAFGLLINRRFSLRPSAHPDVRRDVQGVFRFAVPLWMSGILNQFQRNISAFFLGTMSTIANVGIFAIVGQVNLVGHAVYRAVIVAVKPMLARLHDQGDRTGLRHVYTTTTRWLLMTNIPFFLAMALYPASILAIFGEDFEAGATALAVMAFAELVNAGTGICGSLIDMTGHTRVKVANSVLWLATMTVANALLIPRFGILGAAYAYLISISVVNGARMVELWVLERVAPSWRAYGKPLLAGSLAVGLGLALQAWLPVGSAFLPAFAQGIVVALAYVGLLVLFGIDAEDRELGGRMFGKVTRKLRRS